MLLAKPLAMPVQLLLRKASNPFTTLAPASHEAGAFFVCDSTVCLSSKDWSNAISIKSERLLKDPPMFNVSWGQR